MTNHDLRRTTTTSGLWYNNGFYCNTYGCLLVFGMWYSIENRFLTHVSDAYRNKDEVRVILSSMSYYLLYIIGL